MRLRCDARTIIGCHNIGFNSGQSPSGHEDLFIIPGNPGNPRWTWISGRTQMLRFGGWDGEQTRKGAAPLLPSLHLPRDRGSRHKFTHLLLTLSTWATSHAARLLPRSLHAYHPISLMRTRGDLRARFPSCNRRKEMEQQHMKRLRSPAGSRNGISCTMTIGLATCTSWVSGGYKIVPPGTGADVF